MTVSGLNCVRLQKENLPKTWTVKFEDKSVQNGYIVRCQNKGQQQNNSPLRRAAYNKRVGVYAFIFCL